MEAARYFYNPFEEKLNSQQKFIEILYHDNRDGFVMRLKKAGKEKAVQYATKEIKLIENYDKHSNIWISMNTFNKPQRNAKDMRSINGFYLDLDCHNDDQTYIDNCIDNTEKILAEAYDAGILPRPTMVTATGRGFGLYYVLERSIANTVNTRKMINFWNYIYKGLYEKFKEYLSNYDFVLDMDSTSVGDKSRVVRLPMTVNQHNGAICSLEQVNYKDNGSVLYYDLKTLSKYTPEYKKNDDINTLKERNKIKKSKIIHLNGYKLPFLSSRIKKLELLQEKFNAECTNKRRELMCFYYFNCAVQLYPDKAVDMLYVFNQGFEKPISLSELDNIIHAVNSNKAQFGGYEGYYKIKDETIIFKLDLADEEQKITGFGIAKRKRDRENKKIENKIKKEKRDEAVINDIISSDMTYKEIGAKHDISESTVKRIASKGNIRRNKGNASVEKIHIVRPNCDTKNQNSSEKNFFTAKGSKSVKESLYGVYNQGDKGSTNDENNSILKLSFSESLNFNKDCVSGFDDSGFRCDGTGQIGMNIPKYRCRDGDPW